MCSVTVLGCRYFLWPHLLLVSQVWLGVVESSETFPVQVFVFVVKVVSMFDLEVVTKKDGTMVESWNFLDWPTEELESEKMK